MKYPSNFHINLGIKVAKKSNVKRGKLCAMAFSGNGELITCAHNRRITANPSAKVWTEHAEIVILNKLKRIKAFSRYSNIIIFILRISSKGITMSKPCRNCQTQLKKYPVNVVYTNHDGLIVPL